MEVTHFRNTVRHVDMPRLLDQSFLAPIARYRLDLRMAARAATSPATELYETADGGRWTGYLDRYEEVVSLVSSEKKRSKGESLEPLDRW